MKSYRSHLCLGNKENRIYTSKFVTATCSTLLRLCKTCVYKQDSAARFTRLSPVWNRSIEKSRRDWLKLPAKNPRRHLAGLSCVTGWTRNSIHQMDNNNNSWSPVSTRCRDYFAQTVLLKEMFFEAFTVIASRIYNSALFKARLWCILRINEHENNWDFWYSWRAPLGMYTCMRLIVINCKVIHP